MVATEAVDPFPVMTIVEASTSSTTDNDSNVFVLTEAIITSPEAKVTLVAPLVARTMVYLH